MSNIRTRVIKFEKYSDPLDEMVSRFELEKDTAEYGLVGLEDGEEDEVAPRWKKNNFIGPAVIGEFGLLPISDKNLPSKIWNFWTFFTNFNISQPVAVSIENCPGIESLSIFSRYRGRIGIAKLFVAKDVMDTIEELLCKPKPEKTVKQPVYDQVSKFLSSKYPYYALLEINHAIIPVVGNSTEEVESKIANQGKFSKIQYSWKEVPASS